MKRLIALVLLAAALGTAYADVAPERKLSRPLVILPQASIGQLRGPLVLPLLRLIAPGLLPVIGMPPGSIRLPQGDIPIPIPPVCNLVCRLRPVQAIAQ